VTRATAQREVDKANVLVVDDEDAVRSALERFLGKQGHAVLTTSRGDEALEVLRGGRHVDLILLDVRMPGMSGIDIVPEALEIDPDLAIVMLSGLTDATTAAICMQRGAMDYLTKPIELTDLASAVARALTRRQGSVRTRQQAARLKEEVEIKTLELQQERERSHALTVATLEALVNALEAKDRYLAGHSARIAALSATIAHELSLPAQEVEQIRIAGRLHDLGKIGVRESVLGKQGPLTPEERAHVREHVIIGSQILAPLTYLGSVIGFVRSHHENWDGSGYPDGLSAEDIPLGARVIGTAEVYDALTTPRAYQKELAPEDATRRMRSLVGTVLDPVMMEALADAVARRQTLVFLGDE
jgi:putative two-component system response regulator